MPKIRRGYRKRIVKRKGAKSNWGTLPPKYRKPSGRNQQVHNRISVPVGLGFPKRITMTHKYNEFISLGSVLGAQGLYVYSTNSIYDPNITAAGHQPIYADQMFALYDHYTVIGSKMTVKLVPNGTDSEGFVCGLLITDTSSSAPSSATTFMEQSQTYKHRIAAPNQVSPITLSAKWSAKKFFGGSIMGNVNLQGTNGGRPAEQSYYSIVIYGLGGTSITCNVMVDITYIAVWEELKPITAS